MVGHRFWVSLAARVELFERHAEPAGVAADLVERDQPVEVIEDRVLDPLGHHRAGVLLEPHDHLGLERACDPELEQVAEELEQIDVDLGPVRPGRLDRLVDVVPVGRR